MSEMASTEGSVEQTGTAQTGAEGAPSQAEGAQQAQATEAPPDPRVMSRLDELGSQLGQMAETFSPVVEAYQSQQGQEDPFAELGGEEFVSALGESMGLEPQQVMDRIGEMVDQRAQQIVGQQLSPIQEHLYQQQMVELEQRYPDLQDPAKAGATLDKSSEFASEVAQALGLPEQAVPALATSPAFVELVYKAGIADQHAASQSERGEQQEVRLEQAGASAQQQAEPSRQEQILAAPGGASGSGSFGWT